MQYSGFMGGESVPRPISNQSRPGAPSVGSAVAFAALLSLLALGSSSPTAVFEVLFLFFVAVSLFQNPVLKKKPTAAALVCVCYIVAGFINSTPQSTAELKDFALIYKFLYYLAGLALVTGCRWITYVTGYGIFKFFMWLFIVVYTAKRFGAEIERPIVFIENNYELIPLILAAVALACKGRQPSRFYWGALLYVCAVSGSRSSLVALVLAMTVNMKLRLNGRALLQLMGLGVAGLVMLVVLYERLGSKQIEQIDRVVFLMAFLYEVRNWGVIEWLTGSPAMTPLSSGTCISLKYYAALMSSTGTGSCYSVIFHSFILRVLFDHGIIGLLFSMYVVNLLLRKRGYKLRPRLTVIGILIATGLSVSSLNNVYAAFGIMYMMALSTERKNGGVASFSGAQSAAIHSLNAHLR